MSLDSSTSKKAQQRSVPTLKLYLSELLRIHHRMAATEHTYYR